MRRPLSLLLATMVVACARLGPSDQAVVDLVMANPPTLRPAHHRFYSIAAVQVKDRGRYNAEGRYWPVRVVVQGTVTVDNPWRLPAVGPNLPYPVQTVREARLSRNDYAEWVVTYE